MWQLAARYSAVGIEMTAAVVIGTLGGRWLDSKLGSAPYLTYVGIIVGIGAAVRTIMRVIANLKSGKL